MRGPPELVRLGRGVNEMAARLGAMRARNRALEEQILTLQDEERADIARDLEGKRQVLEWLLANNINSVEEVGSIISEYYSDQKELLAKVRKK